MAAYHAEWETGRGAALSLKLASRSRRSLCQPDSKLFYASGALIFHTVSSHDSLFPQRKIAGIEKKKRRTPCDRLVHCAAEFRLQAVGDEGRGRAKMETVHSGGVCMLASQRGNVGLWSRGGNRLENSDTTVHSHLFHTLSPFNHHWGKKKEKSQEPPLESFRNCSLLEVINLAKHIPHLTPAYRFMWAGYARHPAPKISPRYICESVIRDAHSSWLDTYLYATACYSRYFTH